MTLYELSVVTSMTKDRSLYEALHNYSQGLIELAHALPDQIDQIKETISVSIKTQSDAPEVTGLLKSTLNKADSLNKPMIHTTLAGLNDLLTTIRLVSEHPQFNDWVSFFAGLKSLQNQSPPTRADILTTIRHFANTPEFFSWGGLLTFLKSSFPLEEMALLSSTASARRTLGYFQKNVSYDQTFKLLTLHPQSAHAFSFGQLDSKKWMIDEAKKVWSGNWGTVFILAGWAGVAARFLFDSDVTVNKIRSFDVDPEVAAWAETLNRTEVMTDWRFKASTFDIYQLQYPAHYSVRRSDGTFCELFDQPDLVINTSCEHLSNITGWWAQIPVGTKVILQSNDGFHIPDHSRCFRSLEDFKVAMNLSTVLYAGATPLAEFNRFMLIGVK